MTEKTDNELIAEFMGFRRPDGERYYVVPAEYKNLTYNEDIIEDNNRQLFFSESWDWLMPVVEKIVEVTCVDGAKVGGAGMALKLFAERPITTSIEAIHKGVVDWIKWYNETTQP
jgi:hypothetical protein